MVDWTQIATTVDQVAKDIVMLAPLAAAAGPEGAAIGAIIAKGASYVSAVAEASQLNIAGVEAIGSNDLQTIQAADAKVQADMAVQSILIQAT